MIGSFWDGANPFAMRYENLKLCALTMRDFAVSELPQSYGCPGKCNFFASSLIDNFTQLDAVVLEEIFE